MPFADRPQLIMGLCSLISPLTHLSNIAAIIAYEPSLDQAGHLTGPYSKLVNVGFPFITLSSFSGIYTERRTLQDTLGYVDGFGKDLHDSLVARNLTEIVDVVFVSDHGMTDTSHPELVYMDEILGEEGWSQVGHEDGMCDTRSLN